jgi:hypothetical protein
MEEPEVPTEHLHEHIKEGIEGVHEHKSRWTLYVAVSTALMAVFAAMASLQAGHNSNEAMINQIKASDQWAFYQAKGIKYEIIDSRINSNPEYATPELKDKLNKYKTEQEQIKETASDFEKESSVHLERYKVLAGVVTLLQIAIAISAISIISHKKFLWYIALLLSLAGAIEFFIGMC